MIAAMKRREFITLLGSAAAWPLAARAQQATKLSTIGYLGLGTLATESQRMAAFVQRLRELGWVEGRTIIIDYRWAEGRSDSMAEIAAEFVWLKVDVVFAAGTEPALAAKKATALIPIVFPLAADPVGAGMVASLARPVTSAVSPARRTLRSLQEALLYFVFPERREASHVALVSVSPEEWV